MKRVTLAALALLASGAILPATASAALRSPQAAVTGTSLSTYLNSRDNVNVSTDQEDIQSWRKTSSGNSAFTLQIALGSAQGNEIGIYNASQAFSAIPIFPATAPAGWFAVASFRTTVPNLIINLFDEQGQHQTRATYDTFNGDNFGFYIKHDSDLGLTEDGKNNPSGRVRALTFAGDGANTGCWWLCFEDNREDGDESADFDDAVLLLESVNASPVTKATWAAVKQRFR